MSHNSAVSKEKLVQVQKPIVSPVPAPTNGEYLRKLEKSRKGLRRRRKGRRDEEEEEEPAPVTPVPEETPVVVEEEDEVRDRRRRGRRHRGRDEVERKEEPKKEIPETELQQRRKLQNVLAPSAPQPTTEKMTKRAYNPEALMEESRNFDLLYGIQLSLEHHKKELREARDHKAEHEPRSKPNANHLLNFQFNTAVGPGPNTARTYQPVKKKKGNVLKKEAFLQANCHFVLSPGDHSRSLADPNHIVDWMAVEQVYMPTEKIPPCPICLESPPVAGKVTRCGHIFCTPCILHYLSLSQKSWARCPLCFESIYKKALKSVSFRVQEACVTGKAIEMCLIKRAKGSFVASLMEETAEKPALEKGELPDNSLFARITVTTDIGSIIAREYSELMQGIQSPGLDISDTVYLQQALQELNVRQQQWDEMFGETALEGVGLVKPNLQILKRSPKSERRNSRTLPVVLNVPLSQVQQMRQAASAEPLPSSPLVQPSPAPTGPIKILKRHPGSPDRPLAAAQEPAPSRSQPVNPKAAPASTEQPKQLRLLQRPPNAKGELFSEANKPKPKPFTFNPNAREFCFEPAAAPKPAAVEPTPEPAPKSEELSIQVPPREPSPAAEPSSSEESEDEDDDEGDESDETSSSSEESSSSSEEESSTSSEEEEESEGNEENEGDEDRTPKAPAEDDSYHFYQRKDGACVFLHPLNYRCLLRQFEKEEHMPLKLKAKVLYLDKYLQTEETSANLKFLNHLPLGTSFYIAMLDLTEIVSKSTAKAFAAELAEFEARRAEDKRRVTQLMQHRMARLGVAEEPTDPGLIDYSHLSSEASFALADTDGQFPELLQEAPNASSVTPLGWNEVAEKGFCATFWSPSLADAQAAPNGSKVPAAQHSLGGAAAASLSLLTKPKTKSTFVAPQIPTGFWNKNGPPPKKVPEPTAPKEKSTSSWDSPITPLYSESLVSSQFSALNFSGDRKSVV